MRLLVGLIISLLLTLPAAAQNYLLQEGDVLSIEVVEDSSLNRNVLVLPDGNINFPFAGNVRAAGRDVPSVKSALEAALAPNFAARPTVFVSVNQLANPGASSATVKVFIVGQVNNPGVFDIEAGTTFMQGLALTGGFSPFAATKRVQLRRTDPATNQEAVYTFDLRAAGRGAAISGNTTLRDGDVIFVPERRLFE